MNPNVIMMFDHYFKLANKHLLKNKYYTLINVFGLVFGMLSALIIAKYIGGSLQFDSFHQKKDRIYSITQAESINGNPQKNSKGTYWGVAELVNQYPEVVNATRYGYHIGSLVIANSDDDNGISFYEDKIFSTDSSFLTTFTFPLIYGTPRTALSRPNSVVITRLTAKRYFGNSDPVGKTLMIRTPWGSESTFEVTGVLADIPRQSRFNFDFLITHTPMDPSESWLVPDLFTFILVNENADIGNLSKKITNTINEIPVLRSTHRSVTVSLESLAKAQLTSNEYILVVAGIFIILISWINYINQVIVQSYWRMKEIGILRVMGASKKNLKIQFIIESILTCLISLILIVVIYQSIEPVLQSFTNGHLLPLIGDPTPINFIFIIVFIMGVIITAIIPTVILYTPNFGATLRNSYRNKVGSVSIRQTLVVVQFSVSTALIIAVFVISEQLNFMNDKDKGINMENVLIIQAPILKDTTWDVKRKTVESFKEKCKTLPFVIKVTSSTTIPGEEYRQETFLGLEENNEKSVIHQIGIDEHYLDQYEVEFIAGHNFITEARWKNRNSIILNESAARMLGVVDFDKMINTKIKDYESGEVYDLVGIVKDYHQTSLKNEIRPIAFKWNTSRGHFSLKVNAQRLNDIDLKGKLNSVKEIWEQTYHDVPFVYFFLDDKFAAQYQEDQYFRKLFNYFAALSIIISGLGLFGLSFLISTKRQREIGIRKVFGATSTDILVIFLKGYFGPLLLAISIGSPIAYLLMNMWLRNYAYRIEIGFELLSIAWLGLTLIFIFTISYHTIKSAIVNPVSILRD